MDYPWLKDSIQYDPYEEPDYPEPKEGPDNRPQYRNPVIDKSVRVYTVSQESRFLIIRNIPVTDVISELIQQLALYGTIEEYNLVYDLPSAPFTQTVWVKFEKTSAARQAKHKMNKSSFFGKDLWIQYAPEYETLEDTQRKLNGRRFAVRQRLEELVVERPDDTIHEYKRKLRLSVSEMTTSGLLGTEEARPADDFVELQQAASSVPSTEKNTAIEGHNLQPLRRKKTVLPTMSEKPLGPEPREKRGVVDPMVKKVTSVLDSIEQRVEREATKPVAKKRRRIWYVCC